MTERKVLNKYYPPDYDPRRLPKFKRDDKTRKWVQRVMAPFNMKCNTCGEFIYKAKKFNARRERVIDEDFLGIPIWRFYIRCTRCLAEITFKTDLKNCDYAQEHGATRLFEAEKMLQVKIERRAKKEEEDAKDPMKMLEKRTLTSRQEMEELARLEELREKNKGHAKPDYESMLAEYRRDEELTQRTQEEEDEAYIRSVFGRTDDGLLIKRIVEDDDESLPGTSTSGFGAVRSSIDDETPSTSAANQRSDSLDRLPSGEDSGSTFCGAGGDSIPPPDQIAVGSASGSGLLPSAGGSLGSEGSNALTSKKAAIMSTKSSLSQKRLLNGLVKVVPKKMKLNSVTQAINKPTVLAKNDLRDGNTKIDAISERGNVPAILSSNSAGTNGGLALLGDYAGCSSSDSDSG